jgi:hypothetical protein
MSFLDDLPVLTSRGRCAPQKTGLPTPLAKKVKAQTKAERAKAFRDAVWARDKGRSRATGKPLVRSGTTDWDQLGEVDHSYPRSTAPDKIYDVSNGILLSKTENRLRKVVCAEAPEYKLFDYAGPEDRGELQEFLWRDRTGRIVKRRIG